MRAAVFADEFATAAAWELAVAAGRATLLLALGAVAAPVVGRRSAAARHLVWAATLAGVLALPLLRAAGARWTPRAVNAWVGSMEGVMADPAISARSARPVVPHGRSARTADADTRIGASEAPNAAAGGVALVLVLLWGAGAAIGLGTALHGAAARWRLTRGPRACGGAAASAAVTGAEAVTAAARELAARLGVRRPVRLVWGPAGTTPMTWGVRRPVVLLPADAAAWPAPERDAVLRHELAHVRRGDAGWALVAELANVVFWFHPGVWLARASRLRWQERAADALAVASGAERHAYARALVEATRRLVRTRRRPWRGSAAAPALTVHTGLAERLGALTAPGFVPDPCTRRRRTAVLAGAAVGALALGALDRADAAPGALRGALPITSPAAVRPPARRSAANPGAFAAVAPMLAPFAQSGHAPEASQRVGSRQRLAGAAAAAPAALVILVPVAADGTVPVGHVRTAVGGREVAAIYTTDDATTRRAADRVHARLGGSLINYDRVGMTDEAFADVLVENAVEYAAPREPAAAILVVAEPGLIRPFLRRVTGAARAGAADRGVAAYVLSAAPDGGRAVAPMPF